MDSQAAQPSQSSNARQSISLDGMIEGSVTQNSGANSNERPLEVPSLEHQARIAAAHHQMIAAQQQMQNPHVKEFEQKQAAYQMDQQQMFSNMFEHIPTNYSSTKNNEKLKELVMIVFLT